MQLLAATVKKSAKIVQTKYGERVVVDVLLQDGSESAVWGPPSYAPLVDLQHGDQITCSRDSRGKVSVVENHLVSPSMNAPTLPQQSPPANPPQGMAAETKREIAAYIEEMGSLYGFCYQTAQTKLGDAPNEAKQAMASSLFIAAQRKFGLA